MLFATKKYEDGGMSIKITRKGAILGNVLEKFNKKYRIVILCCKLFRTES
jgi:hypothetical protein